MGTPHASICYEVRRAYGIDFADADVIVDRGAVYLGSMYLGVWQPSTRRLTLDRCRTTRGVTAVVVIP